MRAQGLAIVLWALCGLWGCAGKVAQVRAPVAAGSGLVPSERLSPSMLLRQHLHGRYGDKTFDVDCVLQVHRGVLTIVGLTPFGTRAFVLEQRGTAYTFTKMIDRELPFEPLRILEDVHRVFFRGLPASDAPLVSGVQGAERVQEQRVAGVLRERTFVRLDGHPPGKVRVTFGGAAAPLVPAHAVLENGWYGYTLEIDNVEQQTLQEVTP